MPYFNAEDRKYLKSRFPCSPAQKEYAINYLEWIGKTCNLLSDDTLQETRDQLASELASVLRKGLADPMLENQWAAVFHEHGGADAFLKVLDHITADSTARERERYEAHRERKRKKDPDCRFTWIDRYHTPKEEREHEGSRRIAWVLVNVARMQDRGSEKGGRPRLGEEMTRTYEAFARVVLCIFGKEIAPSTRPDAWRRARGRKDTNPDVWAGRSEEWERIRREGNTPVQRDAART